MNICLDARPMQNAHRNRGIGVLLTNLLASMGPLSSGDRVTLLTLHGRDLPCLFPREERIATRRLERPNRFNWMADHLLLPGLVRRSGADIFLATDMNSYLVPPAGIRVVSLAYDLIPFIFPEVMASQPLPVRIGWRTNFRKLKTSDLIMAISRSTHDDLVRLMGVDPERVRVVYPGIDHALFNTANAADPVRRREVCGRYGMSGRYLLYVGGSEGRKNLRRCLEALQGVDRDVKLVLAGRRALNDARLHGWIGELGLTDRVVLTGFVPDADLPLLYGGADAFLFPSLYEGFGLPVAEAMACGCPVITSAVSSLPEVAGDAGLLVDPTSVADIRGAMIRVVADDSLRCRMAADGVAQASRFTWERAAAETVALLREVAAS